jgi:ribosomal protein S27E
MIVCPKCRFKSPAEVWLNDGEIESVINGVRIQIKCPKCERYTCFFDEEAEVSCSQCGSKKKMITLGMGYWGCSDCNVVFEKKRRIEGEEKQ